MAFVSKMEYDIRQKQKVSVDINITHLIQIRASGVSEDDRVICVICVFQTKWKIQQILLLIVLKYKIFF